MAVSWVDESRTIEIYEGTELNHQFHCVTNVETGHHVEMVFLSSTLPSNIEKEILYDGENISGLRLTGTMPSILTQETYRLTARLQEYHTIGGSKIVDYRADAGITIINNVLEPSWKQGYTLPEAYEKSVYSTELSNAIDNVNGDEVYRKSSGSLPNSMTFYPNGVLSGSPVESEIGTHTFGVTVYRNNEVILEQKEFNLIIKHERYDVPPSWITESGMIGSVNAGDPVEINVIAVINTREEFPEEDKIVTYKLIEGELPPGLELSSRDSQGIISGRLATNQVSNFNFRICPYRHYDGAWYPEDPEGTITQKSFDSSREFYIVTNNPSPEHKITWGEEGSSIDGGSFQVGTVINDSLPKAVAADDSPITYTVIDYGNLPSYITIGLNGSISGTAQFPVGEYYCFVRASTDYTYVTRKVEIKIIKGLGYNSLNLSLVINLEYKDEYNEIRNQLNPAAVYGNGQEGYNVEVFPKIDIATLTCFDRELLAGIFNYGNPEVVRFLDTRFKTYTDEDINGESTATYEAYYKAVDENTYQWDDVDNGNFDFEQQMQNEKDLTSAAGDTVYDKNKYGELPFYPMESDAKLEFNNEYYNSVVDQKQWEESPATLGNYLGIFESIEELNAYSGPKQVNDYAQVEIIDDYEDVSYTKYYWTGSSWEEVGYKIVNKHITTTPQVEYKVFNFKHVREALQKKIYVYKETGDFYYDMGNQQLFEKNGITVKKLYEVEIINEESEPELQYHMCNEDDTEDVVVTYKEHKVYDGNGLVTNVLFKPTFDTHPFMIDAEEEIYNLEEISDPWCLDFNKEENDWLSMDKIPEGERMCLPRITDDDVTSGLNMNYIQMLDPKVEPLPKWKRKEAKYWEAETTFDVGDILYYDTKYYLVIKKFTTDYAFEYDTENMRLLTNDEVKDQLSKQYFPTLDLGYYKSGKNRAYLKRLNEAEKKGQYWYRKDFFFWEVNCEPVYNESIDTFGVPFIPVYNTREDYIARVED